MILMQRLVVSSTRAIRTTLERRLEVLNKSQLQTSLRLEEIENSTESADNLDDWYDMDGQELLDELLKMQSANLQIESSYVETLLTMARQCEQIGPDAKAEVLIEWIYQLQSDENEMDMKVLIFTEFVPTQAMLKEFLEARGISVVTLNGSMAMDERKRSQDAFRDQARVLFLPMPVVKALIFSFVISLLTMTFPGIRCDWNNGLAVWIGLANLKLYGRLIFYLKTQLNFVCGRCWSKNLVLFSMSSVLIKPVMCLIQLKQEKCLKSYSLMRYQSQ